MTNKPTRGGRKSPCLCARLPGVERGRGRHAERRQSMERNDAERTAAQTVATRRVASATGTIETA